MIKAVEIINLSKKYIVSHEKEAMIRHILPKFFGIRHYEEFWALQNINLEIKNGEYIGLIGRNGAGKSTLLNVLAGITIPTQGKVLVNGKISAILTLGAGFHPELTGEENIYLNASILGLRLKDIKKRFNEIVEFSELKDFIDAPLQTYSSGMYMRLGFSVAIHIDFDILLIDEILSVGDIGFQEKCIYKLKEFRKKGATLVIISQSPDLLKELCDKVVLLEKGKIEFIEEPQKAITQYQEMMSKKKEKDIPVVAMPPSKPVFARSSFSSDSEAKVESTKLDWGTKTGTGDIEIKRVRLLDSRGKEEAVFETGQRLKVWVYFVVHSKIADPHFGIAIFRDDGIYCYGPNTRFDGIKIPKLKKGGGWFSLEYRELNLLPGNYKISVAIWEKEERFAYAYHCAFYDFKVCSSKNDHGVVYLRHKWLWKLP